MAKPEELSLAVLLEMRAGKAAELLCAGLRVATCMKSLSGWKMLGVILSPVKPAKQKGHHHCHPFLPPKGNGRTVNINRLLKQRPTNNQALGSVCSAKLNEKQQALWKR